VSWRSSRATDQIEPTHRQVAVIDLGSNSWRLVVYTYGSAGGVELWWKRTDELYETVRIGEGMNGSGILTERAIARGLETLVIFERYCRAHGLGEGDVHAIATSAIRDADNRADFLARARPATRMTIAAVNSTTLRDGAVVELGGGSLQLVHVAGRRARELASFPLGAVRLTERLLPGAGPHRRKELQRVRAHVRESLGGLDWLARSGPRLVGVGGAVRNLADAAQRAAGLPDVGIQGYVLTREVLDELIERLAAMPVRERGALPGIKPGRGDIILAAALTLEVVLHSGGFEGIEATEAGLREGIFLARTLLAGREPLLGDVRASAVRNLAIQYESDLPHVDHVARLALQMHASLSEAGLFTPDPGERELLWAAAMLHDVGMTIAYDDHHKHSRYLIVSAELPGFDPRERALIAQISRYHRKGAPKLGELAALARDGDEQLLSRCAMLLRLAEHLERGRDQSVGEARLVPARAGVGLELQAAGDLTLPRWSLERYGDDQAFERVFGRRLLIG
jgi:exopolyphosphatase/guanosine-5'-triphosphate,3'-diphosphate pyrophosphatase